MQENTWRDWLNRRGVTDATIEQFGLYSTSNPTIGGCIVIPVRGVDGMFSFNKYRRDPRQGDIKPKYIYDKGSHSLLFGADMIDIGQPGGVLMCEGELDALVAHSVRVTAVSSTGGAGTFMPEWADLLLGKDVTLCYDNDPAGGAGMAKVFDILVNRGIAVSVLFLPDRPGVKDISDYVGSGGDLNELLRSRMLFDGLDAVLDDRAVRLASWRSTYFHDAYIAAHSAPVYETNVRRVVENGDEIAKAKSYPITDLLKFNREHKTNCIWHTEDTPSLHYFKNTNTAYCFGMCGRVYDSIDIVRKLHGYSFREALNYLV